MGPRECLCEDGWEGERCEQGIDQCVVRCAPMTSVNAVISGLNSVCMCLSHII